MTDYFYSRSEIGTILAALRLYQSHLIGGHMPREWIEEIATDSGSVAALSVADIDHLCEKING